MKLRFKTFRFDGAAWIHLNYHLGVECSNLQVHNFCTFGITFQINISTSELIGKNDRTGLRKQKQKISIGSQIV